MRSLSASWIALPFLVIAIKGPRGCSSLSNFLDVWWFYAIISVTFLLSVCWNWAVLSRSFLSTSCFNCENYCPIRLLTAKSSFFADSSSSSSFGKLNAVKSSSIGGGIKASLLLLRLDKPKPEFSCLNWIIVSRFESFPNYWVCKDSTLLVKSLSPGPPYLFPLCWAYWFLSTAYDFLRFSDGGCCC